MKQRRINIDGLGLVEGHFSGVGQYILGIARGLDDLIEQAKVTGQPMPEIRVIIPYNTVKKFESFKFKNIGYKKFPLSFRVMSSLWYRGKLPPLDLWCGRGTYIFPRFVKMPLLFSKFVLVVFDLSYELHKQYSDDKNARFLSEGVKKSVSEAETVIVISESVKREITDFYKLDASAVRVAYPAADLRVFYRRSPQEIKRVKFKYGIEGDYILSLSNLEPRKNVVSLVDTYCRLPKSFTDKTALLLVGVSGWKTEALFGHIKQKVEEGYNIIRPSKYVSDKDKPAIISGAKMLVYPSHYEGFGMPPLEALACGVPVITSDNSSLPEAVGKTGKMVPSDNQQQLLEALQEYINDIESISGQVLKEGPEHARQFSWTKSARTFLDAVEEVEKK